MYSSVAASLMFFYYHVSLVIDKFVGLFRHTAINCWKIGSKSPIKPSWNG